ncbi:MAG: DUF4197 domain-containing protein [Bacteroidetes bacterium]|nr:DUF4197 domain-containing protein [Bacteroidota bacterium]
MKKILLTAIAATVLIAAAQAQNAAAHSTGIKINTNGFKPRTTLPTKTSNGTAVKPGSSTATGTATGAGSSTSGSTSTSGKGGKMGDGSSSSTSGGTTSTTSGSGGTVTQSDALQAVLQLLKTGVTAAVTKVAVQDGFYGNPEIKIPLPPALQQAGSMLTSYGAGAVVDKLVLQLNRSAEQSATLATPIFVNSLTQITPNDAVNIITGAQQDAATQFLKRTTTEQLVVAFKPKVQQVLDQTKTSAAYSEVINLYNKIPFVSKVSADLPDYVTRKALDGLFVMVGKEEAKIRQNPAAAGSSILSKVLGSVLGQVGGSSGNSGSKSSKM